MTISVDRPAPQSVPAVLAIPSAELAELRFRQRQISRRLPGQVARIGPCVTGPELFLTGRGQVCLVSALSEDPLVLPGGGYVLPEPVLADLLKIRARGVEFHGIAVAHDVSPEHTARIAPLLQDGPRSCTAEVARTLVGPVPGYDRATALARTASRVVEATAGLIRRVPGALARAAAPALLDPVIFGLISADGRLERGRPVLWVACSSWEW